ncbi:hypothetical protein E2R62_16420 [Citrobacter rodentium]|uniref:Uncharacterized protein n=1 Tax=Citrobacter rodentium TaxID=67825 RepID=A0A482PHS9_CITRO|nr:hypothetical protein E2R62_16420 [Citrobacter rodentium]
MRACYASGNMASTRNGTRKSNNFPLYKKVSRAGGFIYDFRILSGSLPGKRVNLISVRHPCRMAA